MTEIYDTPSQWELTPEVPDFDPRPAGTGEER